MTLENSKRLLKHYQDTGNEKAAADMAENLKRRGESPVPKGAAPKTDNNK